MKTLGCRHSWSTNAHWALQSSANEDRCGTTHATSRYARATISTDAVSPAGSYSTGTPRRRAASATSRVIRPSCAWTLMPQNPRRRTASAIRGPMRPRSVVVLTNT